MSDDCIVCGARPRHQRMIERRCTCGEIFTVKSDQSLKRFCSRDCQLRAYRS